MNNFDIFENENHLKPSLSKSEFENLHSWDFGWFLLEPLNLANDDESELSLSNRLSPGQKALYFFWYLDAQVTNGGFIQFYWNGKRKYVKAIKNGLKLIGDEELLDLVDKAEKIYLANKTKFDSGQTTEDFSALYEEIIEFEDLDDQYYDIHDNTIELIEKYARLNKGEFANFT